MKRYILPLLLVVITLNLFSFSAFSEEATEQVSEEVTETESTDSTSEETPPDITMYTISYGKGLYLSYNGKEPNNFIKGTPPESQTVPKGGSFVAASNTFTFRDYSFGGWKYTYTNASGEKKSKYYQAGETIHNVSGNMKLEATWTKKDKDLIIDAYLLYANTNEKTTHYMGEITVLNNAPTPPADNYEFCGWTDNNGSVLYKPGDSYEINNINTVIKPVWSVDGEQINYRKISVSVRGNGKASVSEIFILSGTSQKIDFTADEGYFLSDVTVNGVSKGASSSVEVTVENNDIEISATFSEIQVEPEQSSQPSDEHYINVVIKSGKGSFSPEGKATVSDGGSYTLTFVPDSGYILPLTIEDNGDTIPCGKTWDGVYTLENITENHTITIGFLLKQGIHEVSLGGEEEEKPNPNEGKTGFAKNFVIVMVIIGSVLGICCVFLVKKQSGKKKKRKKGNKPKTNKQK